LWAKLSDQSVAIPIAARWIGGVIAFVAFALLLPKTEPKEEIITLASLETKIGKGAVTVMHKSDYDKTYAKLGQEAFDRANALVKWAAITAVISDSCNRLEIIDISDQSTVEQLQWFADCQNGERFQITQQQAEQTRDRFANAEPDEAIAIDDKATKPNSAALDNVNEAVVVGSCDNAVKAALKSRGSYDLAWSYQYREHPDKGRVSVTREFEAQNSFGANISSQYECIVDAKAMELISLRIKEPTGWETLIGQ